LPEPVSEFVLRRRVQFRETDAAGLVHFSCFFNYMEEAEHALWRSAGLTIFEREAEVHWPRLACSFEYHAPLRFEEEFEAHLRIVELGERTIRYVCHVRRDGTAIATGQLTAVCVIKRPREPIRSTPIPAAIRERFAAVEAAA
jgi:YbgC/YbaW family acyl-CoA thioester hydrolase